MHEQLLSSKVDFIQFSEMELEVPEDCMLIQNAYMCINSQQTDNILGDLE